eukprot:SAG22_NODE_5796_length_950_cov_7.647474_1_plen_86_part_10
MNIVKSFSTRFLSPLKITDAGRRDEQRDWKSGDPGRKDRLQMPQVESDDTLVSQYTSTLHDRLGRQITRDGSIKFKPGTLRAQPRR